MEADLSDIHVGLTIIKRQQQRNIGAIIHRKAKPCLLDNQSNDSGTCGYVIELYDFTDNEQFSHLDTLLVQIGDCNLLLSEDFQDASKGDGKKINNLLERKNIEVNFMKRSYFQTKESNKALLEKICGSSSNNILSIAEKERPLACSAIGSICQVLNLMDTSHNEVSYQVKISSLSSVMKLDSSASEAINLLPKPDHPSAFGSIFGILNKCKTKMGSRLLERWLRQPLLNHEEINQRLDIVQVLKSSTILRNKLTNEVLRSIPDLDTIITKMQKKNAGLSEVYRLYMFSKALPKIISIIHTIDVESKTDDEMIEVSSSSSDSVLNPADSVRSMVETLKSKFQIPFQSIQGKFELYEKLVEHVIDMNKLPDLMINCKHDPELQELQEDIDEIDDSMNKLYIAAKEGWCQDIDIKIEESNLHGYVFRSTKGDDERQIRANNSSVRIISILKNGVHFTTPQLERLVDRRREIDRIYKDKQSNLASKTVETAISYLPLAELASSLVAELDVLAAFAVTAATSSGPYVRPKIMPLGSGVIKLKGARHPCVELMDDVDFIANDYELVRDESSFQIITGPNMGGKSTYIRGVGSIIVMAQVGSYVPCSEDTSNGESAIISVVDSILARVGAGDATQKGVSTFMAEMLEASVILQTATTNSLLIVDELGRGTSTFDGFGIAFAISEYIIRNINCTTLFATHFHELTVLDQHHKCVVNKHVAAVMDKNELVMLYWLKDGPCLQSFGINVATSAGFPKSVIEVAKRKAAELENHFSQESDDIIQKKAKILENMKKFIEMPLNTLKTNEIKRNLIPLFPPRDFFSE